MTRLFRGAFIVWVVLRYGLDELLLSSFRQPWLRMAARIVSVGRRLDAPRGVRLRQALERGGVAHVGRDAERFGVPVLDQFLITGLTQSEKKWFFRRLEVWKAG